VLVDVVSNAAIYAIMPFYNAHEFWTKIQEKYDVPNRIDCIPSTSGRDELLSTSQCVVRHKVIIWSEYCNVDS
jgi:hypothetical protein